MNDITVILPIHALDVDTALIINALNSISNNRETYKHGKINLVVVCPSDIKDDVNNILVGNNFTDYRILPNSGKSDFCSQINFAASKVNTPYFSILEYDDEYSERWFNMWHEYLYSREDVSIFLPINRQINLETGIWQYCNEIIWANAFSNELGYIDYDCLMNTSIFNLTGGVFNTADFNTIGGFKTDIEVAFNYELLLRATNKSLRIFVVPKEGYYHSLNRKGSLTDKYLTTMSREEITSCFEKASAEHIHINENKEE